MYALAAEHCLKDLVKWNGDNGATYMFQVPLALSLARSLSLSLSLCLSLSLSLLSYRLCVCSLSSPMT